MGVLDGWRFCPRCRAELRLDGHEARCPACGSAYYATSQPTVGALCVDDEGRVLLARRRATVYDGYWDIPGGFLEEGEHPLDALRRELEEETGLDVEPLQFLGAWVDWYAEDGAGDGIPATLNLYWTARVLAGDAQAADDVSELRWFAPDELPPPDALAFTNVARVLDAWRQQDA